MKSVAQRGIDLIIKDASKGIFQKDSTQYKKFPYSSGYKKYKANSMNRFSDGAKLLISQLIRPQAIKICD